jgi:hypothetical protein
LWVSVCGCLPLLARCDSWEGAGGPSLEEARKRGSSCRARRAAIQTNAPPWPNWKSNVEEPYCIICPRARNTYRLERCLWLVEGRHHRRSPEHLSEQVSAAR